MLYHVDMQKNQYNNYQSYNKVAYYININRETTNMEREYYQNWESFSCQHTLPDGMESKHPVFTINREQ